MGTAWYEDRTHEDDDAERQEEEAKGIVGLAAKETREHEEELDKGSRPRQEAGERRRGPLLEVRRPRRDLPRDRVDARRVLESAMPDAEPNTSDRQGDGDEEPEGDDGKDRAKGNGTRRASADEEQVQEEDDRKYDARWDKGKGVRNLPPVARLCSRTYVGKRVADRKASFLTASPPNER